MAGVLSDVDEMVLLHRKVLAALHRAAADAAVVGDYEELDALNKTINYIRNKVGRGNSSTKENA